ncbi:hypothetical protein KCV01_g12840, partial [Aureobasidium melanogenum]
MVVSLSGRMKWNSDADGLFLAAPRRTGKSTFLRNDLKPALEAAGVEVIYLDLWANLQVDPTEQIYTAVGRSLMANAGVVAKLAERAGLEKVKLGAGGSSLEFDATKIGRVPGSSLTEALRLLSESAGKVALILDEAQHLLVSERGDDVARELKAARDTLNAPGDVKLMLVMSGSDRDKLGRLTNAKSAAFYGSRVRSMPLLDDDYVHWMCGLLARSNPNLGHIDATRILEAFRMLGNRPREMDVAISNALNPRLNVGLAFEHAVLEEATQLVAAEHARYRDIFLALPDVQQAVLTHLLESGDTFIPFGATALSAYSDTLGRPVSASTAQVALNAMRDMSPPLIWKSNRGEYALDDLGMETWYQQKKQGGRWPPQS